MKRFLVALSVVLLALLLVSSTRPAKAASPTITLLTPLPTTLAVGESYTIDILIESDEPFQNAISLPDAFFPGRGVHFHGGDVATNATSAVLHMTVTGKNSTADLPGGVAPLALHVGVRYAGGILFAERWDFNVTVP
ncbi:MAG: hypothetical protein L0332_08555 [Chloroflexi bacterium]|nr:hypothetical protein [Chloroflexota bacterium]MCI0576391.1 hypothetical protein [Chloroflexota bacterium]MCI0643874.1 hypothetical protein [Chloroflexota bacterium]MCI0726757.1 hypothetical protein [Chloroflexota bacterium]